MLQPGDEAPDFTATATDGNVIALHDYFGRTNVVLYFYPEDDTSGCTREACEFRDAKASFDVTDAVILGVSGDDQGTHKAFTDKYALNFPLLVDSDGAICDLYGVPRHERYPARVTFLIDTDGIIRHVWEKVNPTGHAAEVHEKLAELRVA
jgi:peroxiredoxin Q/BCP